MTPNEPNRPVSDDKLAPENQDTPESNDAKSERRPVSQLAYLLVEEGLQRRTKAAKQGGKTWLAFMRAASAVRALRALLRFCLIPF